MTMIEIISKYSPQIPGPQDLFKFFYLRARQASKRHEISLLLEQEEWLLKDMGITRDDVRAALKGKKDPAEYLELCRNRTIAKKKL